MKRIVIIGYGNPLREDDGIGRVVAEQLADRFDDPRVTVIPSHQLNLEMAESLAEADCALFIDAAANGIPGVMSLTRVRATGLPPESFSHRIEPSALLAACQSLYGRVPEAVALTVSGERFDFGEDLSPSVAEVLPILVERVCHMVESECRAGEIEEYVEAIPDMESLNEGGRPG